MISGCLTKDIIDIGGLCDVDKFDLTENNWTQITVAESLVVPVQKPDIEQINSINVCVNIVRQKVIVTPKSGVANFEGKILTGRKLIVEGELCQTISYTADVCKQSVHSAHFTVPFSAYIVIPATITPTGGTAVDTLNVNFQVNACVEDLFVKAFSKRQIFKNVILLLQAVPAPLKSCPNGCLAI